MSPQSPSLSFLVFSPCDGPCPSLAHFAPPFAARQPPRDAQRHSTPNHRRGHYGHEHHRCLKSRLRFVTDSCAIDYVLSPTYDPSLADHSLARSTGSQFIPHSHSIFGIIAKTHSLTRHALVTGSPSVHQGGEGEAECQHRTKGRRCHCTT